MGVILREIVFLFIFVPFVLFAADNTAQDLHVLELKKLPGMPSVPVAAQDMPQTEEQKQLAAQLNALFQLQEIRDVNRGVSYDLARIMQGDIEFAQDTFLHAQGVTLPYASVRVIFEAASDSQVFPAAADALGNFFLDISLVNTPLGEVEIFGETGMGQTSSDRNYWGKTQIVRYVSKGSALPDMVLSALAEEALQETTTNITAPTIATVALLNTGATVPLMGFLPYFVYLFSEPFRLLFRKRNKGWGVVYDSLTKQPLDLAIVRLFDKKTHALLQTRVTDVHGRYNFVVDPGVYFIEVQKDAYVFPSEILQGKKQDAKYSDLYLGDTIAIESKGKTMMSYNIPLDVHRAEEVNGKIILGYLFHQGQRSVALLGPVFSLISFAIHPTPIFFTLVLLHFVLYYFFWRLTYTPSVKGLGSVLDQETGIPLGNVVVKLFDAQYNKLLETKVTNTSGQYSFLVGENEYYFTAEKRGYAPWQSGHIRVRHGADGIISKDLFLQRPTGQV